MASFVSKLKQPHELLNHILDQPELPTIIQRLDARVLTKLIHHIGLEDSAQIVSMATTDQLKGIFDEDLWHSKAPGAAETFDAARFGLWLTIMLENGSAFAAKKVMAIDEALVTLGFCRLVLVMRNDDVGPRLNDAGRSAPGRLMDRVLDNSLNQQFGNYLVIAKNADRLKLFIQNLLPGKKSTRAGEVTLSNP